MSESIEIGLDTLRIDGDATKLFEALAKAQADFVPVAKTAEGAITEKRKFKYADYNTLTKCVRPSLTRNGIALLQPLHSRNGMAVTTTIIAGHGASIQSSMSFKADPNPQEFGRHHTYYRRYQLQAMLGLAGDDDADEPPMAGVHHQEPTRDATTGDAVPKAAASAAKPAAAAKASANGSSASSKEPTKTSSTSSSEKKTESTASGSATNGSNSSAASATKSADTRTMSEKLIDGMKQKKWTMANLKEFYIEHVDPAGFQKTDDVTLEKRQLLWQKMIDVAGVVPF